MRVKSNEPKIVVVGGGTGLSVLLKGLKEYTSQLTAVVTVTDDGGSSGRLRNEMGVLPPGDIRNCLVALADTETLMDKVFQHRFRQEGSLKGHNLGNLLLVALTEIVGDFISAIKEVSKVLAVRGKVIPVTLQPVNLGAVMADETVICGQTAIRNYDAKIDRVFLICEGRCLPVPDAIEAIMQADAVVIGPGSLYTSIIPNLLVEGVAEAIEASPAQVIYVCNIMTEKGETDDYSAEDHIAAINQHLNNRQIIDYAVVNSGNIDEDRLIRYKEEQAVPVRFNRDKIQAMGIELLECNLVSDHTVAWHDPRQLARVILKTIGIDIDEFFQ
ncbi:MAG: gluconeogenesis factor YvcK family protein [Syntrophomonadaceae bacterium]|jgi:uncharacterized cofD-like protein